MSQAILIMTNVPDIRTAAAVARQLVENRLAACVNMLPPIRSIYQWEGAIEEAEEITLLIKTSEGLYEKVETAIVEMHPYDVPEVIMLPITKGLPSYLNWIKSETSLDERLSHVKQKAHG